MQDRLVEKFVRSEKNTLLDNIILCTAVSLSGTFYIYEAFYGEALRSFVCLLVTALILVVWLICALFSGKDGKNGFAIFAFLYWGFPYIYSLWYNARDNLNKYNKWLDMIEVIAEALVYNPFREAARKMGTSPATLASLLVILIMGAYMAGYSVSYMYYSKRKKPRTPGEPDHFGEYIIDDDDLDDFDRY